MNKKELLILTVLFLFEKTQIFSESFCMEIVTSATILNIYSEKKKKKRKRGGRGESDYSRLSKLMNVLLLFLLELTYMNENI